jgi:hypothetical protein
MSFRRLSFCGDMETVNKIVETLRVPNFFRDILFTMGGAISLTITYFLLIRETGRSFGLTQFVSSDLNVVVIFLLLSFSYFFGRINEVVANIFMDCIGFFDHFFFFQSNKDISYDNIKKSFFQSLYIFFRGSKPQYQLESIRANNPNRIQVLAYYSKNKAAFDENERSIYSSIIFDQLFVFSLISGFFLSKGFFVLAIIIMWRAYKVVKRMEWHYHETRREVVFQNDQRINNSLVELKAQGGE